jgi:hypothetical protein
LASGFGKLSHRINYRFPLWLRQLLQAQLPQPPRKTATSLNFRIISERLKLVQSGRGSMAVAEPAEATNLYGMIFLNSPIALN